MPQTTRRFFHFLFVLFLPIAACSDSPGKPSDPGGSCRNVASAYVTNDTAPGFSNITTTTCNFNGTTRQFSCTFTYSNSTGASGSGSSVTTYTSVADFVDEVAVIAPRTYALSTSSVQSGTSGPSGSGTAQTFDANRRLTQVIGTSAAGVYTTTYTAWEASGRPTNGTDVGPGFNNTLVVSYDNVQRTRTTSVNGGLVTTTETFDANGNLIRHATAGGNTAVVTINQTQQVCK